MTFGYFCLVALFLSGTAQARIGGSYVASVAGRFAEHTRNPVEPASERLDISFLQQLRLGADWRFMAGASAWEDEVYSALPARYPESIRRNDSREVRLRDFYLQYKKGSVTLRLGNQQVVWGEAFGGVYSDIVNPRDLRDGLSGDLSTVRLQTPMLNLKIVMSSVSFQGLVMPKPYFNILPDPYSDFSYPYKTVVPFDRVEIQRESFKSLSAENTEFGGRISWILKGWDMSAFGLNHFDRNPYYAVSNQSVLPRVLILQEQHARVNSFGATLTKDLDGFLVRAEVIRHEGEVQPIYANGQLTSARLSESTGVVGLDLPTWHKLNIGVQWTQNFLTATPVGLLQTPNQKLVGFRLERSTFRSQNLTLVYAFSFKDHGHHGELNYNLPLSDHLESVLGVAYFNGPGLSDFGRIRDATRVFISIKYFLNGGRPI